MLHKNFNWKTPDYLKVINERTAFLRHIRSKPESMDALKVYYQSNPIEFIEDFGWTHDPRNVNGISPAFIPFILFPRQREWLTWALERWEKSESGIVDKSRDMGLSWLAISLACTLCLFNKGMVIGFGSRVEDLVDKIGDPDSLFFKARMFMRMLPQDFRGGWLEEKDAPHMRILFPQTGSVIKGQSGAEIGRGGRASLYFVDEAAHLPHPELVDAALSQTTRCRIDLSSVNGFANPFAIKRHSGNYPVFTFHWRDDPRKNDEWYAKESRRLGPVVTAQEIDINYSASVTGALIPGEWVQAAVDAHVKLGFHPTGARFGALDIADEGKDTNCFCGVHGNVIEELQEWSGKGSDIYQTTQWAFELCDRLKYTTMMYDADGLGAGVRGDAKRINEDRKGRASIQVNAFRGSGELVKPESEDVPGRKNEDFFSNRKAQAWWSLRTRFERTYRAVVEGSKEYSNDDLISIPSVLPARTKLLMELSQPTYKLNNSGKIVIDKTPNGAASPNLADAVMMRFSSSGVVSSWVTAALVQQTARGGMR